jgi:hypothetical protein
VSTLLLEPPVTTDPLLLHAFARRDRPVSLGELLRAMAGTGLHLSEVPAILFRELAEGRVVARGFRLDEAGRPSGPRLYELTESGWEIVEADRLAV